VEKLSPEAPGSHTLMVSIGNIKIINNHDPIGQGQWNIFASVYEKGPPPGAINYIHINDYGYSNLGFDNAFNGRWYPIDKAESVEISPNGILRVLITGTEIDNQIDPPDSKKADCFGQACPEADDDQLGEVQHEYGSWNNYGIGLHCATATLGDYYICYTVTEVGTINTAGESLPFQLAVTGACNRNGLTVFDCAVSGSVSGRPVNKINCYGVLLSTDLRLNCSTNNGQTLLCNSRDQITFTCKYA
jgi:hypothetical protein